MTGRVFFDTNIPFYAFASHFDERKRQIAIDVLSEAAAKGSGVLSLQVFNEFVSIALRKSRPALTQESIRACLAYFRHFDIVGTDFELVEDALLRTFASQISYYDALIVEAAIRSGARVLYSEDMQHGMRFGDLQVVNPFRLQ